MKTVRFFPFALAMLLAGMLYGQGLRVTTYAEQTKISTKMGTSIGYSLPHSFTVGGFYQQSLQKLEAEPFRPLTEEWEFFGVYATGNLYQAEKFEFDVMVRTGVTNRENFAIVPSIMASFKPVRRIEFSAGMGVRCFNPTLMGGITLNLN